jgi:integrase
MALRTIKSRLYLEFYCYLPSGRKVRCREPMGQDTAHNRKRAQDLDRAVKYSLKFGTFDYLRFFAHGSKAKYFTQQSADMTFTEWWGEWTSERSVRASTARSRASTYQNHLNPYFGTKFLRTIDEHEVLVFRRMLQQRGYKEVTINEIIKRLCTPLRAAYRRGKIATYPCEGIVRLADMPAELQPFSFDELTALLNCLEEKEPADYDMIFVWSRTGMRPGEIFALKWERVDYFNKKISVRETRHPNGSEGPPKTKYSVRDIDMRAPVRAAFKRQEGRTGLIGRHVFLRANGKPWDLVSFLRRFRYLCQLAGVKQRPCGMLRHTFATLHIASGESISWVSQTMGHSSVDITLKKYNRFIPNLTREDGSAFERMIEEKAGKKV